MLMVLVMATVWTKSLRVTPKLSSVSASRSAITGRVSVAIREPAAIVVAAEASTRIRPLPASTLTLRSTRPDAAVRRSEVMAPRSVLMLAGLASVPLLIFRVKATL